MGLPNANEIKADAKEVKASNSAVASRFGVYQLESGSYRFGDVKFDPNVVTAFPASTEISEEDDVPVKVFSSAEAAQANLAKLQKQWDAKKGKG